MENLNRRDFLAAAGALGGAVLLGGCGSSDDGSSSSSPAASSEPHPPIAQEPGKLSILEWGGYEAGGTKAQKSGLWAGTPYTKEFGAGGLSYTYIVNDNQSLQKASTGGPFDVMHPCIQMVPDFVDQGLVQPWDPKLLKSFDNLDPYLLEKGKVDGKQYMIPWDWGFASLLYRTDMVDAADATSWDLAWNEKYKGKIALWNGSSSNFELTGLRLGIDKIDDMTPDEINRCKEELIKQKPLNKFLWSSEYGQMHPAFKSGDIWITYSWQAAYVIMKEAGLKVDFMDPEEGRLSWACGFMLGADTKNYHHAHKYVESFINHKSNVQMVNLFYYGSSDTTIKPSEVKNKELAKELKIGQPNALEDPSVHLQQYQPNRSLYEQAWSEVTAS
jgi:spermidine/putrescine transport system substrate-binding protein